LEKRAFNREFRVPPIFPKNIGLTPLWILEVNRPLLEPNLGPVF